MKIAFCTHGCKVNQYETQCLRELFINNGFEEAKKGETPDIFLLNSCTVTAESDRKNRQMLRRAKKQNPNCVTVLFGCMAQAFPQKSKNSGADIVFGNTDHKRLLELVNSYLEDKKPVFNVEKHILGEQYCTPSITYFEGRTRAYMKIEDGCDRFCSYCAIPYARGRVRSRSIESIEKESAALAEKGYIEIVLVGINLSAYGTDIGFNLLDAVNAVSLPEGIKRVRLGSLEPDHLSNELLLGLAENPKFCPQFHLSLQSGSTSTLKRMNRHYDAKFYCDLVERIKNTFENPAITTDIMVGFAGETESEFSESLEFVKQIGFAKSHVFAYSVREGTAAEKLPDHIEKAEKARRSEKMIKVASQSQRDFLESQIGKISKVLFETDCEGYTENYTRVKVSKGVNLANTIKSVELLNVKDDYIEGELL